MEPEPETVPPRPQLEPEPEPTPAHATAVGWLASRLVYDEPDMDDLGPIRGVFDDAANPAVDIFEAIQALPIDLSAEAWTLQKFLKRAATKDKIAAVAQLTPNGAGAIWLFTCESPLYHELNTKLRARDRKALRQGFFPYLRLLLEGMRALVSARPRMINRGVPLDVVSLNPGAYAEDESLTWWCFSSCTKKISVLNNPTFLGSSGDRTIFQVTTRHGVDIGGFSAHASECEVLLPPGISFVVKGVLGKDASGLTIVQLEDDTDAPMLIL